jgi:hypothetical protein
MHIGISPTGLLSHTHSAYETNQKKDYIMFNDTNFHAVIRPIFDANNNEINPDFGRGVYRSDTDELLSVCGPNFKPVQHGEILDPVLQTLKDQGYEIQERNAVSRSDMYDLAGHKGAFCSVKTTDNGAVMKADIIIGDFIRPTGSSSYMDNGPDTMLRKHSLTNSHNSKYAVRSLSEYMRIICMNGICDFGGGGFRASSYGKHTLNFNSDVLKKQILNAASLMEADADLLGVYAKTALTPKRAEEFLMKTFAKLPNKPNGDSHYSEGLCNEILTQFNRETPTIWGLVNALTHWSTHGKMREGTDKITGRIGSEEKVSHSMRSKIFTELYAF